MMPILASGAIQWIGYLLILALLQSMADEWFAKPMHLAWIRWPFFLFLAAGFAVLRQAGLTPILPMGISLLSFALYSFLPIRSGTRMRARIALGACHLLWFAFDGLLAIVAIRIQGNPPSEFSQVTLRDATFLFSEVLFLYVITSLFRSIADRQWEPWKEPVEWILRGIALLSIPVLNVLYQVLSPAIPWMFRSNALMSRSEFLRILVMTSIGLAGLAITLLVFLIHKARRSEARRSRRQQEEALAEQNTQSAKDRLEELKSLHFRVLQLSHDLRYRLLPIALHLREGHVEEAIRSIDALLEVAAWPDPVVEAPYSLLDISFARAEERARKSGVILKKVAEVPPQLGIPLEEICVVLGNALDNAIEASRHVRDGASAEVNCFIGCVRTMFVIRVENPCADIREPALGTGLLSIRQIVEKYNGKLSIENSGGRFHLLATLPLPSHSSTG